MSSSRPARHRRRRSARGCWRCSRSRSAVAVAAASTGVEHPAGGARRGRRSAFVLGLIAAVAARAGARAPARAQRSPRGRRSRPLARLLAWAGLYLAVTGGARARLLRRCCARLVASAIAPATPSTLRPCSRSATASGRRACAAGSSSPGRAGDEDPRRSTCARSRTSGSSCSRPQTYVKGFLRTYAEYLGLDGQLYVDEYNSRFVAGRARASRPRRSTARPAAAQPRARDERRPARARAIVAIVTVVVISAWKSAGGDTARDTRRKTHVRRSTAAAGRGRTLAR